MPKLHKKVDCGDYYAKANAGGAIVTYQISRKGVELLAERAVHAGCSFDWSLLILLKEKGFATTGGSGITNQIDFNYIDNRPKLLLNFDSESNLAFENSSARALSGTFKIPGEH